MLEPTLRYGLQSSSLDLLVRADGGIVLMHTHTGGLWETRLLSEVDARHLEFGAIRDDFHRRHCQGLSNWGRDYGDESDRHQADHD